MIPDKLSAGSLSRGGSLSACNAQAGWVIERRHGPCLCSNTHEVNGLAVQIVLIFEQMVSSRLVFRVHAIQRMFQRHFSEEDIRRGLESGEVIEEYPDDKPYPSRLVLSWVGSRPVHMVVADNAEAQETIVITVYEPEQDKWEADFKRRKKP